jgi:altronate hydrolase
MRGYLRADGRKGIRNVVVIAYLVDCAHHVAREIVLANRHLDVQLIGFPGCYKSEFAEAIMTQVCTHPNVGAVLLVSLGCEWFDRSKLSQAVEGSGRPCGTILIQESGGTGASIEKGVAWVAEKRAFLAKINPVPMRIEELIVGGICGGSDWANGLTSNRALGAAFDQLIDAGATCMFDEMGELVGCEYFLAERAANPELGQDIIRRIRKAGRFYAACGQASFAPGNAEGGLSTIEEKSLGSAAKSGSRPIQGIILPGERPRKPGLYMVDTIPDTDPKFGFPALSDNSEIVEFIASGAHLTIFSTGRGSVVGSAISPVIKVCSNSRTFSNLKDDMDVDASRILNEGVAPEAIGEEIVELICATADGKRSRSEALGHQEFILFYKNQKPMCG